jgi:replicative DNA helicase
MIPFSILTGSGLKRFWAAKVSKDTCISESGALNLDHMRNSDLAEFAQLVELFVPGELTVICGRPSMGKTSTILNLIRNPLFYHTQAVALFSIEKSKESIMHMLTALESDVSISKFRSGNVSNTEMKLLATAARRIAKSPLYVDERAKVSVAQIGETIKELQKENCVAIVVIDYLQLLDMANNVGTREAQFKAVLQELKALATSEYVAIVVLSQLYRGAFDKVLASPPALTEFEKSIGCVNTPDNIVWLYRPSYYDQTIHNDQLQLHLIKKHLVGSNGIVKIQGPPF